MSLDLLSVSATALLFLLALLVDSCCLLDLLLLWRGVDDLSLSVLATSECTLFEFPLSFSKEHRFPLPTRLSLELVIFFAIIKILSLLCGAPTPPCPPAGNTFQTASYPLSAKSLRTSANALPEFADSNPVTFSATTHLGLTWRMILANSPQSHLSSDVPPRFPA